MRRPSGGSYGEREMDRRHRGKKDNRHRQHEHRHQTRHHGRSGYSVDEDMADEDYGHRKPRRHGRGRGADMDFLTDDEDSRHDSNQDRTPSAHHSVDFLTEEDIDHLITGQRSPGRSPRRSNEQRDLLTPQQLRDVADGRGSPIPQNHHHHHHQKGRRGEEDRDLLSPDELREVRNGRRPTLNRSGSRGQTRSHHGGTTPVRQRSKSRTPNRRRGLSKHRHKSPYHGYGLEENRSPAPRQQRRGHENNRRELPEDNYAEEKRQAEEYLTGQSKGVSTAERQKHGMLSGLLRPKSRQENLKMVNPVKTKTMSTDSVKELLANKTSLKVFEPHRRRPASPMKGSRSGHEKERQRLTKLSKADLQKWLDFALEEIQEAHLRPVDSQSTISSNGSNLGHDSHNKLGKWKTPTSKVVDLDGSVARAGLFGEKKIKTNGGGFFFENKQHHQPQQRPPSTLCGIDAAEIEDEIDEKATMPLNPPSVSVYHGTRAWCRFT